jgi:hypothetical protein
MKKQFINIIVGLIIIFSISVSLAKAQITIAPKIKSTISDILSKPMKLYELDLEENNRIFEHIDNWFEKHINLKEATPTQDKQGGRLSFKILGSKALPILPPGEKVKGVVPKRPFSVLYIKESQKRSFIKELRVPTKRRLPNKDVIEIGKSFIKSNKFCKLTNDDTFGAPLVISRKRHKLGPDAEQEDELTLFQGVVFKREFFGIEVINSKQIVSIHPDSHEIISYKNVRWTPVNEASGKIMPYISQQEVIAKIESRFAKSKTKYKVKKIKAGMYQTDKIIFPVLVIYTEPIENYEVIPIERVLVISLIKGLDLEEEKKS